MYNFRLATEADCADVLEMCEKFYNTTKYSTVIPFDPMSAVKLFYQVVRDTGFVVVAELEGQLVGMLGATIQKFVPNNAYTIANEIMWWVEEGHRNLSVGGQIISFAEEAASSLGCHLFSMSTLATSNEEAAALLEKSGYMKAEHTYVKGVGWLS